MTEPADDVPIADWELARHGKHRQPSPLVRRLRHLQYVLLHRRRDRRTHRLIRKVHGPPGPATAWRTAPPPPLVEFTPDEIAPPTPEGNTDRA